MDLNEKLDLIEKKISSEEFRNNTGTANEVGYYVFDYDPKDELKVRDYIDKLVTKINSKEYLEYHINCFDLYDLMIQSLKEEDILDDILDMEETDGYSDVSNTIQDTMGINSLNDNYIINTIKKSIDDKSIVFITGVGKAYPIIRAHKVLKNTHLEIDNVPVVIFLPGKYSGLEISLFGKLNTNYYRAFKLID